MHFIISEQREQIAPICKRVSVAKLEVLGSAACGLYSYVGLKLALEAPLESPVDLVEPVRLRNPYVLADTNRSREVVYAA